MRMEMNRKVLLAMIASLGMTSAYSQASHAACNATVNGRPMSSQICALATEIYGYVGPGHYWLDQQGNWGRLGVPYPQGNLYVDAQRGKGGSGSNSGAFSRRTPFGTVMGDGKGGVIFNAP